MTWDRRLFLKSVASAGLGATLDTTFGNIAAAAPWPAGTSPYGELTLATPVNGGQAVLALPPGFSYRTLSTEGRLMSDGIRTPSSADGMAAFQVGGFIRLLRNHEIAIPLPAIGGSVDAYDAAGGGAVTTIIVDPVTRAPVRDFLTLSGTVANCSGGRTPWNSWISCEESLDGPEVGFQRAHGYCFEVPADAERPVAAIPLKAMGRFRHEAVAIDPGSAIAYMTEDQSAAGFYRYVPTEPIRFALAGRLQMLAVAGIPQFDTFRGQRVGDTLPVAWVDIPEPDPVGQGSRRVYEQGFAAGGARFRRLEGAVWGNGSVYFSATTGGDAGLGQIWRYTPYPLFSLFTGRRRSVRQARLRADGELTLLFESRDSGVLKAPDNVCVSPRGSLLICEDATVGAQYVRVLSPSGELFDLVRNAFPGLEHSELAGVTFSPDGETLFFNIYGVSMTIAVWGPWRNGPL